MGYIIEFVISSSLFIYSLTNGNLVKINKIQFDHVPFAYFFCGSDLLITFGVRHVVKVWDWRQAKEVTVLQTGHGLRGQNVSGVGDEDGGIVAFPKKHSTNFEFIKILYFTKE